MHEAGLADVLTYRSLWQRVIQQSLRDAMELDAAALRWLLIPPDADFLEVCSRAGQDPRFIRQRISIWLLASTYLAAQDLIAQHNPHAHDGISWTQPSPAGRQFAAHFQRSEFGEWARRHAGARYAPDDSRKIVSRATLALATG